MYVHELLSPCADTEYWSFLALMQMLQESSVFFLPVFELARLLEDVNTWRKECIADAPVEAKGKFAYAKIHQVMIPRNKLYMTEQQ